VRGRAPLPLIAHAAGWAILGCAFVVISVPHVWAAFRANSFRRIDRYHTTDGYMASLLHVTNGSERLAQACASLPPNQAVAVVLLDGDDEGVFLSHLVTYFAWPREVHSVALTRANAAAQMGALQSENLGAIFFCRVDPPPTMMPAISIGSELSMVPTSGTAEVAPK
jgi:hypothetical protein